MYISLISFMSLTLRPVHAVYRGWLISLVDLGECLKSDAWGGCWTSLKPELWIAASKYIITACWPCLSTLDNL